MKPATAAKKLGVHLDVTPVEFRAGVVSRDELDRLGRGRGGERRRPPWPVSGPGECVVLRAEDDRVGQVRDRGLLGRGDGVFLRDDGHGGFGVERDRVEPGPVDRQPDQGGVHRAGPDQLHRLVGGRRDQFQGDVGTALGPDPHPLARGDAWDVAESEDCGVARLGHRPRLSSGPAPIS
jgi:hypothetical protein